MLEQIGLLGALEQRLDVVERRRGHRSTPGSRQPLSPAACVEDGLYRIAQEALNNALKHASPRTPSTAWCGRSRAAMSSPWRCADDGVGFTPPAAIDASSIGLLHMHEGAGRMLTRTWPSNPHPAAAHACTVTVLVPGIGATMNHSDETPPNSNAYEQQLRGTW
ncbi:MAG: hypothetical protein V9G19_11420 [Tetrasphaera sp.]